MAPFFEALGVTPIIVRYGYFFLLQTRLRNDNVARKVCAAVKAARFNYDEIYVVGHSNGCSIAELASRMPGFSCDGFTFISPALRRDQPLQPGVAKLHVWHSPSDLPVSLTKYLPFRGNWGRMGAVGYKGAPDSRIVNFNKERDFLLSSKSHSDVFEYDLIPYFGPVIAEKTVS